MPLAGVNGPLEAAKSRPAIAAQMPEAMKMAKRVLRERDAARLRREAAAADGDGMAAVAGARQEEADDQHQRHHRPPDVGEAEERAAAEGAEAGVDRRLGDCEERGTAPRAR